MSAGEVRESSQKRKRPSAAPGMIRAMIVTVLPMHRRDGTLAGLAVVDYEDWRWASATRWSLSAQGYAVRKVGGRGGVLQSLHRLVLGLCKGDGLFGDHVNGDRLDCRRANLRVVTPKQSAQNVGSHGGTSRHRGVCWDGARGLWVAQAVVDGTYHHLGRYVREEDAARAVRMFRAERMPFSVERDGDR